MRALSDSEKAINLTSIDDLVDNNFMTNRGPGNGVYKPEDFSSAYVNVPMMSAIYGGNTSGGLSRCYVLQAQYLQTLGLLRL